MPAVEMVKFVSDEVERALGVRAVVYGDRGVIAPGQEIAFTGVSTDSRTIKSGELFFAIKGTKFDGHQFVGEAMAKGAAAAVVRADYEPTRGVFYKVDDPLEALGTLAMAYRRKFNVKCVAITGSNGKTTTKEMTAACLSTRHHVLKTMGNFNNLIGVPLTIFVLDDHHQAAVFELGMSQPGEIGRLAEICQPQIGVFTNIAPVHLESMGSIDAIAEAKFELAAYLGLGDVAVVNVDDPRLRLWPRKMAAKVVTYGIESEGDFMADDIIELGAEGSCFTVSGHRFKLRFPGRHNIYNALAAIAASASLGIDLKQLADVLAELSPGNLRSEVFSAGGVLFIDDCYNANPNAMLRAIDMLAQMGRSGRTVAVLADMLELGPQERNYHVAVGKYLSEKGINCLLAYGQRASWYLEGFDGSTKISFTDKAALAKYLSDFIRPGDVVLFKGSRGMALEEVSKLFRENH